MEEVLVRLLGETQSSADGPRTQAEEQLQNLYYEPSFPLALCSIAAHQSVPASIRQSALIALKNFVLAGWSPQIDDFKGQILVSEDTKDSIRAALLDLATSDTAERKIQSAASYVVSKIAAADFPDHWGGLLPSLLQLVPQAGDASLHGALKVLADLIEDGLNEKQFFGVAQDLVDALHIVAQNEARHPALRALALSVFCGCFDTLEMVLEDHKLAVKTFAGRLVDAWMSLFKNIMNNKLPAIGESQELYNGHIALKLQVVKVLMKIRIIFPSLIAPQSVELFLSTWDELSTLKSAYQSTYIEDNHEGRLEDGDGLQYTLDFLVLEDLDFMQACMRAPPVRKELEAQLKNQGSIDVQPQSNWITNVMQLAVTYAQITTEEEGIWQFDVNVFLSEETSVTANYTARTACGDLVVKLGEWLKQPTIEGLLSYAKTLHSTSQDWRLKEAALYILTQVLGDWQDTEQKIDVSVSIAFLELTNHAIHQADVFLRARGFLVAAILVKTTGEALHHTAAPLLEQTLRSTIEDSSEIVQVSCIRALQQYLSSLPTTYTLPLQTSIISALSRWMSLRDLSDLTESDDLMITLLETLRDTILLDSSIAINGEGLNLLFNLASQGAANFQVTSLVTEVFEEICNTIATLGNEAYIQLCHKVLPSLIGAFDVGSLTEENALTNLAAELLSLLTRHSTSPFPPNFVSTVLPKLSLQLLHSTDSELLKSCTACVRYILQNDAPQLLSWQDPSPTSPQHGKSGLEIVLLIIDRLLSTSVDDNAAAEVGGLAAEAVEKAGPDKLGPYLMQLLQAVAVRLASATQAQLIQSLILVFARLAQTSARDVVDFLSQVEIPQSPLQPTNGAITYTNGTTTTNTTSQSALDVVLAKWLENSVNFAGYDSIRTNVLALAALYSLRDPRLASVLVKGDLLVPGAAAAPGRIVTRSRARQNPDSYTMVPVPVKIVKVLVEELVSGGADVFGAEAAVADGGVGGGDGEDDGDEEEEEDEEDGDWEDEPGILDLGLGSTKADLMAWGAEEGVAQKQGRSGGGGGDDETQAFLRDFFREAAGEEGFAEVFEALGQGEREKLRGVVWG